MSVDINPHLTNLVETCRSDAAVIDEGGKERPWYKAVIQIFRRKQKRAYFAESCMALAAATKDQSIRPLSLQDKFDILFRIEKISAKLSKDNNCADQIQTFKQHILSMDEKELEAFAHQVLQRLTPHSETYRSKTLLIERDLRILEVISRHYQDRGEYSKIKELHREYKSTVFHTQPKKFKYAPYRVVDRFFVDQFRQMAIKDSAENFDDYHAVFMMYVQACEKSHKKVLSPQANLHKQTIETILEKSGTRVFTDPKTYTSTLEQVCSHSRQTFDRLQFVIPFALAQDEESLKEFSSLLFQKLEQHSDLSKASNIRYTQTHLEDLQMVMAANQSNTAFINECLVKLDSHLQQRIFQKGLILPETDMYRYKDLEKLFDICDQHIDQADEALKLKLKVKLANLPVADRSKYSNAALTNTDQLNLLIAHFDQEQERLFNQVIGIQIFSSRDRKHFVKLVSDDSLLQADSKQKLRERLREQVDWNDETVVGEAFDEVCSFDQSSNPSLKQLRRVLKAKKFFSKQLGKQEEQIVIPMWYHTTKRVAVEGITTSKRIQVKHENKYKGAWVSSVVEDQSNGPHGSFGTWAIALRNNLQQLDEKGFIGYQYTDRRWRGPQKPIPVCNGDYGKEAMISIPKYSEKKDRKEDKRRIRAHLRKKYANRVPVMSYEQREVMREGVAQSLGLPNLNLNWWGKN